MSKEGKFILPILLLIRELFIKDSGRMDSLMGLENFSSMMDLISMGLFPMDLCMDKEGLFRKRDLTMKDK